MPCWHCHHWVKHQHISLSIDFNLSKLCKGSEVSTEQRWGKVQIPFLLPLRWHIVAVAADKNCSFCNFAFLDVMLILRDTSGLKRFIHHKKMIEMKMLVLEFLWRDQLSSSFVSSSLTLLYQNAKKGFKKYKRNMWNTH